VRPYAAAAAARLASWPAPRTSLRPLLFRFDGDLLGLGVMDLRAMAVVTAAITVERLAPAVSVSPEPSGSFSSRQGCF